MDGDAAEEAKAAAAAAAPGGGRRHFRLSPNPSKQARKHAPRARRTLQRVPGGLPPTVAQCRPADYVAELKVKVDLLCARLASALGTEVEAPKKWRARSDRAW